MAAKSLILFKTGRAAEKSGSASGMPDRIKHLGACRRSLPTKLSTRLCGQRQKRFSIIDLGAFSQMNPSFPAQLDCLGAMTESVVAAGGRGCAAARRPECHAGLPVRTAACRRAAWCRCRWAGAACPAWSGTGRLGDRRRCAAAARRCSRACPACRRWARLDAAGRVLPPATTSAASAKWRCRCCRPSCASWTTRSWHAASSG